MFETLKLLLPALIPSWRFFDVIAPSPRIEFSLLKSADDIGDSWQEFRPRPARLRFGKMLERMIWNPQWNESLFIVSCAERLMENPTAHSSDEILKRIKVELKRHTLESQVTNHLRFRLVFLKREGGQLQKHVMFMSPIYPYSDYTKT